jgi:hypothetical protein
LRGIRVLFCMFSLECGDELALSSSSSHTASEGLLSNRK